MEDKHLTQPSVGELLMFTSGDGKVRIDCRFESDTLWLSQAMICKLYGKAKATISEHIKTYLQKMNSTRMQLFGFTEKLPVILKIIFFNI